MLTSIKKKKIFKIYLKVQNQNIVFIYSVLLCQFSIPEETVDLW